MNELDKSKVGNFGYFWSKLLTIFKIFKHLNSILECWTVLLTYFGVKVVSSWTTFLLTIWEIVGPFLYLKHVRKADFFPAETSFFSLRSWNLPSTFRPFWPLEKKWRPFLRHAFLNGLLNDVNLGVQGPCKDPPTRILGSPWSPHCNLSQKWPLNNWNRNLKSKKVYSI